MFKVAGVSRRGLLSGTASVLIMRRGPAAEPESRLTFDASLCWRSMVESKKDAPSGPAPLLSLTHRRQYTPDEMRRRVSILLDGGRDTVRIGPEPYVFSARGLHSRRQDLQPYGQISKIESHWWNSGSRRTLGPTSIRHHIPFLEWSKCPIQDRKSQMTLSSLRLQLLQPQCLPLRIMESGPLP